MQIENKKVVVIDFVMKDDTGEVLDTSEGNEPLYYLHGAGAIAPGLERALEGKKVGDKLSMTFGPEDAYGEIDPDLFQSIPRGEFEDPDELEVGMQFEMPIDTEGLPEEAMPTIVVTVSEVNGDEVVVDMNHDLAGMTISFEVTVLEVRDATEVELDHNHAHYPDQEDH